MGKLKGPLSSSETESFYDSYIERAKHLYPSAAPFLSRSSLKHLVSPLTVPIRQKAFEKIKACVQAIYAISRQPDYQSLIHASDSEILRHTTRHDSVLMAYDFHVDSESGEAKLIEINTNGSGFLVGHILYELVKVRTPHERALEALKSSFEAELLAFNNKNSARAVVVDHDIPKQNMRPEFYMYQDLMNSWGWKSSIEEVTDLQFNSGRLCTQSDDAIDFVYNRHTDFTLKENISIALRKAFLSDVACISPNPREYILLADKERLVELTRPEFRRQLNIKDDFLKVLDETLLPTWRFNEYGSADLVWRDRKKLFFKPARSFGSKSTYKGESITHKVFERLLREETLIQEYFPAGKIKGVDGQTIWKYDIRAFVYRDQVQLLLGRLYQGQVTNFQKEGGGFCAVDVV